MSHKKNTDKLLEAGEDLPKGWSMAWSRSKQKVYYCNKKLGVSQWTKPTAGDEDEILNVLEQMDLPNKARNTMIRNARKRLREREMISAKKSKQKMSGDDNCGSSSSLPSLDKVSKQSKPGQFVSTFSVLLDTGDAKKKVKIDVPFRKEAPGDGHEKKSGIGPEKGKRRAPPLKFIVKKDRSLKVIPSTEGDSCIMKKPSKGGSRHSGITSRKKPYQKPTDKQTSRTKSKIMSSDLCLSSQEMPSSNSKKKPPSKDPCPDREYENELDLVDVVSTSTGVESKEQSCEQLLHGEEEEMECETSPEEYAKLMNDINEIRENFDDNHNVEMPGLSSELLNSSSFSTEVSSSHHSLLKVLYVIIDTNVLLNSLQFLTLLESINPKDYSCVELVIPWVVMTELDLIKDNKKNLVNACTQQMARSAVSYLHDHLQKKHHFIKVQTPSEACRKYSKFEIMSSNDDKILQCCIQWMEKYPESDVILLTGDTHLRSKAMVLNIPAYKEKTFEKWLKGSRDCGRQKIDKTPVIVGGVRCVKEGQLSVLRQDQPQRHPFSDFTDSNQSASHEDVNRKQMMDSHFNQSQTSLTGDIVSQSETSVLWHLSQSGASLARDLEPSPLDSSDKMTSIVDCQYPRQVESSLVQNSHSEDSLLPVNLGESILDKTRSVVQSALGSLLEHHMKETFGDLWHSIVYKKPPWHLIDILQCLKKHWIAVFGDVFGRRNLSQLEQFIATVNSGYDDKLIESSVFLKSALRLCHLFKENISDNSLDVTVNILEKIDLVLEKIRQENLSTGVVLELLDQTISGECEPCAEIVQSAFQDVWMKIFNISTDFKHHLSSNQTSDRHQVVSEFVEFCALVTRIHRKYSQMLSVSSQKPEELYLYSALIDCLSAFTKHYNMTVWRRPTPQQLYSFMGESRGRTILKNGFLQLEDLMLTVCSYNSFLSAEECQRVQTAINQANIS